MPETKSKRNIGKHACEACRKSKIRCLTDTVEREGKCRKCLASGVECQWMEISKTRRRRRTDARVTELENKLSRLTADLDSREKRSASAASSADRNPLSNATSAPSTNQPLDRHIGTSVHSQDSVVVPDPSQYPEFSEITTGHSTDNDSDRSFLLPSPLHNLHTDTKQNLLDYFVSSMLPQYPVVYLPNNASLSSLESARPFLMNSVLTAACSVMNLFFSKKRTRRPYGFLIRKFMSRDGRVWILFKLFLSQLHGYTPQNILRTWLSTSGHMQRALWPWSLVWEGNLPTKRGPKTSPNFQKFRRRA